MVRSRCAVCRSADRVTIRRNASVRVLLRAGGTCASEVASVVRSGVARAYGGVRWRVLAKQKAGKV